MINDFNLHSSGYITKYAPNHPKARDRDKYVLWHVLIAEKALGRYLPDGVVVHHIDEDKRNNSNSNLVICENDDYHKLLHKRQDILKLGGNPNTEKFCDKCKQLKLRKEFYRRRSSLDGYRSECSQCEKDRANNNNLAKRMEVSPKA